MTLAINAPCLLAISIAMFSMAMPHQDIGSSWMIIWSTNNEELVILHSKIALVGHEWDLDPKLVSWWLFSKGQGHELGCWTFPITSMADFALNAHRKALFISKGISNCWW